MRWNFFHLACQGQKEMLVVCNTCLKLLVNVIQDCVHCFFFLLELRVTLEKALLFCVSAEEMASVDGSDWNEAGEQVWEAGVTDFDASAEDGEWNEEAEEVCDAKVKFDEGVSVSSTITFLLASRRCCRHQEFCLRSRCLLSPCCWWSRRKCR